MKKKVTIIIPNYNGLAFMEPCFASLEKQVYTDYEILVVDNGSTDGSVEWLKAHANPQYFPGRQYRIQWCSQCRNPGSEDAIRSAFEQ